MSFSAHNRSLLAAILVVAVEPCATPQGLPVVPLDVVTQGTGIEIFNQRNYTTKNGLSSNTVKCMCVDRDGMMWFGTNDGLCSFDAYSFRSFLPERGNPSTIVGKDVRDVTCLQTQYTNGHDILLIALADGGVTVYDKTTDSFINGSMIEADVETRNSMVKSINHIKDDLRLTQKDANEQLRSAYGISQCGGETYISYEQFILKHDLRSERTSSIRLPKHRQFTGIVTDQIKMYELPGNDSLRCVILGRTSVGLINRYYESIREIKVLNNAYINSICPKDRNSFYIATTKGLLLYHIPSHKIYKQELPGVTEVQAVAPDHSNGFWIAHDNSEVMKWNPEFKYFRTITNAQKFLNKHTTVNALFEDENGLLWIATANLGVFMLDTKAPKIKTYEIPADLADNYKTISLAGRTSTELYAAVGTQGIFKINIDERTGELIKVPHRNVFSVYVRKNNELYIGTTLDARKYNPENIYTNFVPFPAGTDTVGRIIINDMIEDCLGNIWMATQIGVYKFNGVFTTRLEGAGQGIENVECVYEDSDGRIWCGTKSGSYVKQPTDSMFRQTNAYLINRPPNNKTLCFCDHKDEVLIGTASGVLAYNKQTGNVSLAGFNRSFDNSIIYSIATDNSGIIWISTNSGIGYVDSNRHIVYRFNSNDGLIFMGNDCRKFTKVGDMLYFGNATKLNGININHVTLNSRYPKTYVSSVSYGQAGNEAHISLGTDTMYTMKYLFKASLRISLSSSDFSMTERNEYMYRIDKEKWVNLGTNNEIILSGLMPGKYRVEACSTNSDKMWAKKNKVFYIYIVPPLWMSTPAIVFYVIIIFGLAWLLLNLRFRKVNRKMKQMSEEMRGKKAIEDQRNRLAKIHKDQTDSISYAKRIQEAIMPRPEQLESNFSKLFMLYRPKDIVSGDFCCFYYRDNMSFLIASDCTGHGVPGAFLSILGMDHLFNIIMKQKVNDAGEILTTLHRETYNTIFKNNGRNENFNEGMDITVAVVDHERHTVNFAGAMNDLYIIRDNEIETVRGDRHSIGTNLIVEPGEDPVPKYTSNKLKYLPGDMFYLFSDGYIDQFGGPEQKKFKQRRFKHILLNIHKMPANDQRLILSQRLEEWRGSNEQTDDISVIGFEPLPYSL